MVPPVLVSIGGSRIAGEIAYPDSMPLTSACQVTGRLPGLGTDGSVGGQILAGLERLHGGVGLRAEDSIDRDRVTACPQQILTGWPFDPEAVTGRA